MKTLIAGVVWLALFAFVVLAIALPVLSFAEMLAWPRLICWLPALILAGAAGTIWLLAAALRSPTLDELMPPSRASAHHLSQSRT